MSQNKDGQNKDVVPKSVGPATRRALLSAHEALAAGTLDDVPGPPEVLLAERLVSAIENVPIYRDLYSSLGPLPSSQRDVQDWFKNVPVVTRAELSSTALKDRTNPNWDDYKLVEKRTSGSTGIPFVLFVNETLASFRTWRMRRAHTLHGGSAGEGLAFLFPPSFRQSKEIGGKNAGRLRTERSYSGLVDGFMPPEEIVDELQQQVPRTLIGFASVIAGVARSMLADRRKLESVRHIWTTSETLSPNDAELVERAFGITPLVAYASNEFGFIGYQQEAGGPIIIDGDRLIIELIPHPTLEGYGRVVITDLLNDVTPLIRYETSDLAVMQPGKKSVRTERLEGLIGKEADIVKLISGRTVTPFEILGCVKDYLPAAQYRVICVDEQTFVVQYLPGHGYDDTNRKALKAALSKILGSDAAILVQQTARIEREPSGKLRPLINLTNLPHPTRAEMERCLKLHDVLGDRALRTAVG